MTVADRHDFGAFAAARWTDCSAPFFAPAYVASTKASLRSILPRAEVFREALQQSIEAATALPLLEPRWHV
jgi:hypothetical protein